MEQGRLPDAIVALKESRWITEQRCVSRVSTCGGAKKGWKPDEARQHFEKAARAKRAKSDFEQAGLHTIQGISALRSGKPAEAVAETAGGGSDKA